MNFEPPDPGFTAISSVTLGGEHPPAYFDSYADPAK